MKRAAIYACKKGTNTHACTHTYIHTRAHQVSTPTAFYFYPSSVTLYPLSCKFESLGAWILARITTSPNGIIGVLGRVPDACNRNFRRSGVYIYIYWIVSRKSISQAVLLSVFNYFPHFKYLLLFFVEQKRQIGFLEKYILLRFFSFFFLILRIRRIFIKIKRS